MEYSSSSTTCIHVAVAAASTYVCIYAYIQACRPKFVKYTWYKLRPRRFLETGHYRKRHTCFMEPLPTPYRFLFLFPPIHVMFCTFRKIGSQDISKTSCEKKITPPHSSTASKGLIEHVVRIFQRTARTFGVLCGKLVYVRTLRNCLHSFFLPEAFYRVPRTRFKK